MKFTEQDLLKYLAYVLLTLYSVLLVLTIFINNWIVDPNIVSILLSINSIVILFVSILFKIKYKNVIYL